jgi:pilus assembly protein CpaB
MNPLKSKFFMAAAFAAMAALLSWLYLDSRENELLRRGNMVKVVAAARPLSAYTRIRPRDLEWRAIPQEYVVKGYVTEAKDALDQLSLVAFNRDEPLTYNKISSGNASLSNSVPEGLRAFSIPVDRVSGIAGLVRPGDLVDLLYLEDPRKPGGGGVSTLFQGVKVLAAGDYFSEHQDKSDPAGSVTLALSPDDAQAAMFAASHGSLQLSLRSPGDTRTVPLTPLYASSLAARLSRRPAAAREPEPENQEFIPQKR